MPIGSGIGESAVLDYFKLIDWLRTAFPKQSPRLIPLLFALAVPLCAQEFAPEKVVFPISEFAPYILYIAPLHSFVAAGSMSFGTGFCLDPNCRFVGTTYHVANAMAESVFIKRGITVHRYLDSSPNDPGAEEVKLKRNNFPFMISSMRFNPAHDLAIYQMRHPLKKVHGIPFETEDLEYHTEVDIYGYPFNWNPKRGLVRWHGKFIGPTDKGLLAFSYEEGQIHGGASGGIVVDSRTKKIVGILSIVAEGPDHIVYAVSVKELSNFVGRVQPYLQASLFPKSVFISPVSPDLYPPHVWPRTEDLAQRRPEPTEVARLRETAWRLSESMRDFTAIQTFSWGHDNREPELTEAYETLILDGWQRWRRPRDGKWFWDKSPMPHFWLNASVGTGDLWIRLPWMLGRELDLPIHQAPDAVVGGQTIHVFQYAANAEDDVCRVWWSGWSFRDNTKAYDCHGEVWTNGSGTILRISEAFDLTGPLYHLRGVMTYGWLEKDGEKYPVPVTFATQSDDKKTYWCRSLFTDYNMFKAKARLVLAKEKEQTEVSGSGTR